VECLLNIYDYYCVNIWCDLALTIHHVVAKSWKFLQIEGLMHYFLFNIKFQDFWTSTSRTMVVCAVFYL